jgi:hypothetical protein
MPRLLRQAGLELIEIMPYVYAEVGLAAFFWVLPRPTAPSWPRRDWCPKRTYRPGWKSSGKAPKTVRFSAPPTIMRIWLDGRIRTTIVLIDYAVNHVVSYRPPDGVRTRPSGLKHTPGRLYCAELPHQHSSPRQQQCLQGTR